jgi:hypothetical protein
MNRAHSVIVRACSWLADHTGGLIIGFAVVWMAAAPRPASGQSAWPSYPNNSAISVTSGGNVGIGTTNPYDLLTVNGGVTLNDTNTWQSRLILSNSSSATLWQFLVGGRANGPGGSGIGGFALFNGSYRLNINANGNVGIGTTNPQYLLSVKGTVGAEEFIVTNTGWSDYVFQPGYRLRPLSEVGAYIQANHHLPDIPSEAEVKEKGVSVGEMQSKLLAKVEELTLHMIQADERNNRLEKQNRELRDRLARLEKGANAMPMAAW